jgi:hypothetical protein
VRGLRAASPAVRFAWVARQVCTAPILPSLSMAAGAVWGSLTRLRALTRSPALAVCFPGCRAAAVRAGAPRGDELLPTSASLGGGAPQHLDDEEGQL